MSKIDLNSKEWCDIVFEGKTKRYGAYVIRKSSDSRHNKAMIIVTSAVIIIVFIGFLFKVITPDKKTVKFTEVNTLSNFETPGEMDLGELKDKGGNAMAGKSGGSDGGPIPTHQIAAGNGNILSKEVLVATTKGGIASNDATSEEEEAINPNALYKKGKVNSGAGTGTGLAGGNGTGTGQGMGNGQGTGIGSGNGSGGGGTGSDYSGSGTSFSLLGRGSKNLGVPSSKTEEVGSIVVTIWVNPEGDVTRAVAGARGTTIGNKLLWKQCELAATKSKFSANSNAPEEQKGTITYKFRR